MNTEIKYIEGFNKGYLLAKHEPALLGQVVKNVQPKTDYLQGFFSGREEFELENLRNHLNDLDRLRNQQKNLENELDRDE